MMSNSSIDMALNPSLSCAKEHLNKYFHRHAGALENCFCVSSISALHGGQYQHPVDNCFYWILAFARMTTQLSFRLVQNLPNYLRRNPGHSVGAREPAERMLDIEQVPGFIPWHLPLQPGSRAR